MVAAKRRGKHLREANCLDGDALSQDFLGGLPEGWTKAKLEPDTTGINRMKVDDKTLEEAGLFRPEKNEWK